MSPKSNAATFKKLKAFKVLIIIMAVDCYKVVIKKTPRNHKANEDVLNVIQENRSLL